MANEKKLSVRSPLLVFQCQHCNTILGDSLSLVATDEELRTITLQGASSVDILDEQPRTYEEGKAAGSTFLTIKCKACQTDIGRVFVTTPKSLDNIRDLLSLDAQKISSYPLGSPEVSASPASEPQEAPALLDSYTVSAKIAHMESELLKVENMILLHSERLDRLEGGGRDLPSADGEVETGDRGGHQGANLAEEQARATDLAEHRGPLWMKPLARNDLNPAANGNQAAEAEVVPSKRQRLKIYP